MKRSQYLEMYARLQSTRTKYTECIKLTRATDGAIFRFTALDTDLRIQESNGTFYNYKSADSFKLTALENQSGLVVSNMDVEAIVSDDSITEEDLIAGLYDNANVELFIAYWAGPQIGILPLRTSWIGEIALRGSDFKGDLRGIAQKLQQMFISTTSLECRWSFGDAKCGKDLGAFTRNLVITNKEGNGTFDANIATPDHGLFQWGLAKWLTGNNAGADMEIIRNFDKRIQLFIPMPYDIQLGDTVQLIMGCDKVFRTCNKRFDNAARFGGEPFLAGSDLLTTYPVLVEDEDSEDGGKF